jgi:hypothetical protein
LIGKTSGHLRSGSGSADRSNAVASEKADQTPDPDVTFDAEKPSPTALHPAEAPLFRPQCALEAPDRVWDSGISQPRLIRINMRYVLPDLLFGVCCGAAAITAASLTKELARGAGSDKSTKREPEGQLT